MNIVIPMAGLGSRFSNCGFTLPKPLIKVGQKPMYRHAVDCLPLHLASKLIFIIRDNAFAKQLSLDIEAHYGFLLNCSIVILDHETAGQAETFLASENDLDLNEPTLIHNCDTYFKENFTWTSLLAKDVDGAIVLFKSQEPRWSYVKMDDTHMKVIEIEEKKVISANASTGTYFFRDTAGLLATIRQLIANDVRENNEYYLSTVYKDMLKRGQYIIPLWTKTMMCFGTPQDLVDSLNKMLLNSRVLS